MNGATTAALVNKRDQSVVSISDDGSGAGGMRLIAVESVGDPTQARVQVEKAGQRAWIAVAPSAAMANSQASPRPTAPIDPNTSPAQVAIPELPMSLENFPKPVAPQIAPGPSAAPMKRDVSGESAPQPPMPPSPLDAAMLSDEDEIVVPIPEGE